MFKAQLFLRSILIFLATLLTATAVTSYILSFENSYISFGGVFFYGLAVTSIMSIPNIFILFFGLCYFYNKNTNWKYIRIRLLALWFLLSILPLLLFYILDHFDIIRLGILRFSKEMVLLSSPYIIFALIFLLLINYLFDKKYPLSYDIVKSDDNLLDDEIVNNNED